MGSCSSKRLSNKPISETIIKVKKELTPVTSESNHLFRFPSNFPKTDSHLSIFFEAFGGFPSRFDEPFSLKPIEFRGTAYPELVTSTKLSVTSRKGLKEGVNQDNFCIVSSQSLLCFGMFDGHGENGHFISSIARKALVKHIQEVGCELISEAFSLTEAEILKKAKAKNINCELSGSTATVVTIVHNTLTVAHIGDSRAVLIKKFQDKLLAVPLTIDHKPADVIEKSRIERAGGKVAKKDDRDVSRIYVPGEDLALAVSRTFGDTKFKAFGASFEPFVRKTKLDENDLFLVLATDGLWDVVENYEVANVLGSYDCRNACRVLEQKAWNRWVKSGAELVDDISILIFNLT
jgi:serine/threonine protein phosphatase PrpC